jgi:hypothetical protein
MKKILPMLIVIALALVTVPVLAANTNTGTQGTGEQQLRISPLATGIQVQNKNQVQTRNEGEDSLLQVNTQEQESQGTGQGVPKSVSLRSEIAIQHMSRVAQKVEEILTMQTMQGGIGQQVRQVAQEQKTAQNQIQTELGNVDSRGGLLKSIIGPDYKALKNMQKQMEQNQIRIQEMSQLQNQLTNRGDITQVQEMIQALIDQNTALQDRINLEEQSGSMLGWLFKLLVK